MLPTELRLWLDSSHAECGLCADREGVDEGEVEYATVRGPMWPWWVYCIRGIGIGIDIGDDWMLRSSGSSCDGSCSMADKDRRERRRIETCVGANAGEDDVAWWPPSRGIDTGVRNDVVVTAGISSRRNRAENWFTNVSAPTESVGAILTCSLYTTLRVIRPSGVDIPGWNWWAFNTVSWGNSQLVGVPVLQW